MQEVLEKLEAKRAEARAGGGGVERAELRSGLARGDLDALYAKTQADADNAGFCANAGGLVDQVIAVAK